MPYALGARSMAFLKGVDPALIELAQHAIALSAQDFCITEPQVRDLAEEKQKVAEGHSGTLHSHHLVQADGFGGAIDAVPWDGAKPVWDWPRIYPIAAAFKQASVALNRPITWGAVWDRLMTEFPGEAAADMQAAEAAYVARQHALGKKHLLLDGPHFELGRN